jgi:GNAT superfamily N-acetyltransferase
MESFKFVRIENDKQIQNFIDLWLPYTREIGDDRSDDKILEHAKKIIEIQEQKKKESKIYNIELCMQNNDIIGFCFFCVMEIKYQKDTDYGVIIKPLVNNQDYGYIMEYYIKQKHRLKGYGEAMYYHVKEIYEKHNIKKIMLTPNEKVISFWEKLEFYNTGKIDPTNDLPIYINNNDKKE